MRWFAFLLLPCLTLSLAAQESPPDSSHALHGVEIFAARIEQLQPGLKYMSFDSSLLFRQSSSTLSGLIEGNTSATVRSYGTGGLSTLSLRGTQTTQSGVFWNGFNINQSNIGMSDITLVPAFFFDKVGLQYGGGSAVLGSDIIGGSIQLSNSSDFQSGIRGSVSLDACSYGNYYAGARLSGGNETISAMGAAFLSSSANAFSYQPLTGARLKLEHAEASSAGLIHQIDLKLNRKNYLSVSGWLQRSSREIPATMVMASSTQQQYDESFRTTAQWNHLLEKGRLNVKSAFFSNYLHYTNETANIDARYHLFTYALESDLRKQLSISFWIDAGVSAKNIVADITYYKGIKSRKELAFFASAGKDFLASRLKNILSLRQDFIEGYHPPLCPSIGSEFQLSKASSIFMNASRNFRVPTLNDRYWQPGGNPDLLPETSWNEEIGYSLHLQKAKSKLKFNVSVYNIVTSNLIQWVAITSDVWSPDNVSKVWCRGAEIESELASSIGKMTAKLKLQYSYTPSTEIETADDNNGFPGKQLIYIPLHKLVSNLELEMFKTRFNVDLISNGSRYVTKDNSHSLPAYHLLDISLSRALMIKSTAIFLQFEVKNLFDVSYQEVLYYPEPGRAFFLKSTLTF